MPEGKLLGDVVLSCPNREEVVKLPRGTSIPELLSKATDVFGDGLFIDRDGNIVTSEDSKLDGGYYSLWPDEANEPDSLHICRKGAGPRIDGFPDYVRPDVKGEYNYDHLAAVAGYPRFMRPKYLILGDPEIMRIYPKFGCEDWGTVSIDRRKLGSLGTKGKPVPLDGSGWWGMIKEFVAPPAIPPQP